MSLAFATHAMLTYVAFSQQLWGENHDVVIVMYKAVKPSRSRLNLPQQACDQPICRTPPHFDQDLSWLLAGGVGCQKVLTHSQVEQKANVRKRAAHINGGSI